MANKEHLSDQFLESALDKGLPPERFEEILSHVSTCRRCEQKMERMEAALAPYLHFRKHVAPMFPQPSAPWADIWEEMGRVEPLQPRRRSRPVWVGSFAAVAAALVLLFWPRPDSTLSAETLLQKARTSMAHSPSRPGRRLSVRTQAGSFVRPAVLLTATAANDFASRVGIEFGSADYNWSDPLSPVAFAEWRDSRQHKTDIVLVRPSPRADGSSVYTIRTTTQEGVLQEASLTVEAPEMLPVSARFVFTNQNWVEISELTEVDATLEAKLRVPTTSSATASTPKTESGDRLPAEIDVATRELHVRAGIDSLSLPAGEPIGIEIDDSNQIVVTAYGLASQDLSRLRASIQGIEGVTLRVEDATPKTDVDIDPVIDASESVVSQAHLVSQLAERFPTATEERLRSEDRRSLWELREHVAGELTRKIDLLYRQLGKPVPHSTPPETDSADGLLKSAVSVNRLVTNIYAGGTAPHDAGRELQLELAHLRQLAQAYSNYAARSLETLP